MSSSAPRLRHGLSRQQRLRGPREFLRLREHGQRRVCGCLILNWRVAAEGGRTRLGVVTSRRIGGAVIRNRARRMIREAFRLNRHHLKIPIDLILVARSSAVGRPLAGVLRDLRRGLIEAGLWLDGPPKESELPKAAPCAPS